MAGNTLYMTPEESSRIQHQVQGILQQRQQRRGEPWQRSDADALVQSATSAALMQEMSLASLFGAPQKRPDTMAAYAVGAPYLPCTAALDELKPMRLEELQMETHHRGRALALRRVSPVVELKTASWAVVQGKGTEDVARLEVFLHKSRHGKDVLELCSELVIKEPFYTLNNQGEETIRVDHPSDLVITAYSRDTESWRRRDGDAVTETKTAAQYKEEGNAALQKQDYARSYAAYTEGLDLLSQSNEASSTLAQDIHRNRSHVNLLLQRFDAAREDALASLIRGDGDDQKSLDAKAYYRAGSAAYALGDYDDARGFFEEQLKLQADAQYAKLYLRRIKARIQEKTTGAYDMPKVVAGLSKVQGRPDVASFEGHTEVRDSPGAGRGLFATRDFAPKDIIICEKAFVLARSTESDAFSALAVDARDDATIRVFPAGLHRVFVQKLMNNPSQISKVLDLYGDYPGLGKAPTIRDGTPVIDTFQIHDIVQRNSFGLDKQSADEDVSNASTGMWLRAAYANHSCVANAAKSFVGDLLLLRATRRIRAGEEVTHAYDESSDLEARAAALKRTWGFVCECRLCKAEEADGPDVRRKRRELEEEAVAFMRREMETGVGKLAVSKARRFARAMGETYQGKRWEGLPRRAVEGVEEWIKAVS